MLLEERFLIKELGPERRHYHLDDDPNLQSCTIMANRVRPKVKTMMSRMLERESFINFYGRNRHLETRYVRERCGINKHRRAAQGYELEPFDM
jgi:hypothetical protein